PALTDARPRGHVDAGPSPVAAREPAPFGAGDAPATVELGRRLAEVPDVPAPVLRVPVGRAFLQPPGEVEPVADRGASHTLDRPRRVEHGEDVTSSLAVLDAPVDEGRPRNQREPGVVHAGREAGRCPARSGRKERRNDRGDQSEGDLPHYERNVTPRL